MNKTMGAGLVLASLFICISANAAPLSTYDKGKVSISAGASLPTSIEFKDYVHQPKKTVSPYGNVTLGLGNRMAMQYRFDQHKAKDRFKVDAQQLNLMYNILNGIPVADKTHIAPKPSLSIYAGILRAKGYTSVGSDTDTTVQGGIIGKIDMPRLATLWCDLHGGSGSFGWEAGVSRNILPNIEFDVSYFENRFKDSGNVTSKGVHTGLTIKF